MARPRRGRLLVVAVVSMLVGALVATGATLYLTRDEREYAVTVFMTAGVADERKAAIKSALGSLEPVGDIEYKSSEQARQTLEEIYEDRPELSVPPSADDLPESFAVRTTNPDFACSDLEPIRELPGVEDITWLRFPTTRYCPRG